MDGLTTICRNAVVEMGPTETSAWNRIMQELESAKQLVNVENVLSCFRIKIDALGGDETLLSLSRGQLQMIERKICSVIAKTVIPAEETIPPHIPHDDFALWVRRVNRTAPIEVFTTNYDVLLERSLEGIRVPVFDAFVGAHHPFFFPDCLDDESLLPSSVWVRLWKLHGSVNWSIENGTRGKQIIRTQPSETGEMILPSNRKYDESRKQPYVAFMDRLSRILSSEHAFLITCGYGFGDEHINAILYNALDNRSTNIVALQFEELVEEAKLAKIASQRPNLTIMAPNAGLISGLFGTWRLAQPVENKTHSFMDIAFDSNASIEQEGSTTSVESDLTGKLRLGDFKWFCQFLTLLGV